MGKGKVVAVSFGSVLGILFAFVAGVIVAALLNEGEYGIDGYQDGDEGQKDDNGLHGGLE